MSTWGSKHVEEINILWINNNQCTKVGNEYVPTLSVREGIFILVSYFSDMKLHVMGRDTVRFGRHLPNAQGNLLASIFNLCPPY